jgi:NADPH:quinone reductase-like Zn-dependent oxidoreductase
MTTQPQAMQALRIHARGEAADLVYESAPAPEPGTGDVLVEVHAASYTPGELEWPSTWVDRSGHDRTPSIPCYEFSGVVAGLGFGATGFTVGEEVYGLGDWYRDGAAAELIAVQARNLAIRPHSVDHAAASTLPLAGLTAWQALFWHGAVTGDDTVLVLGAGGGVGNLAVQLAHEAGARVLGAGHGNDSAAVLQAGATTYLDLQTEPLPDAGEISLVFDTVGGQLFHTATAALRAESRVVSIVDPALTQPFGSRGAFFVVEPDREGLNELARRVDEGLLAPGVRHSSTLSEGRELIVAKETRHISGKVSLTVRGPH